MRSPFELLQYLARSPNRVRVLLTVGEEPGTRLALREATGIPRSTLGRVLAGLHRRGLVAEDGDRYEVTPLGRSIATELSGLAGSIETVWRLQEGFADCHPAGAAGGLAGFPAGELSLATPADPEAPARQVIDLLGSARRAGLIAPALPPALLRAGVDGGTLRRLQMDVIVPRRILEAARPTRSGEPRRPRPATDGTPAVFAYDGEVPSFRGYADATAFFAVTDDAGTFRGSVETDDGAVRARVEGTVEAYRADADAVATGVLTW